MAGFLKKYFSRILLLCIFSLYFFFILSHLGKFITADEHYWVYERIPQYWSAINDGKWGKTLINDKPGVTLALTSGSGLWKTPQPETLCSRTPERIITCHTEQIKKLLLTFRIPLIIINTLLIFYLFWIIKKLTNKQIALWSTCFIALSPILMGISQIVNPDALLWSFGGASFFSYLVALRYREKKYILFSGLFLGFALLSKYTASMLIPFFLMASLFSILFFEQTGDRPLILKQLKKNLLVFFFTLFLAVTVVSFFLPAILLKPLILQTLLSGGSETPFIFVSFIFFVLFFLDTVALQGRCLFFFQSIIQKAKTLRFLPYILPWSILTLFIFLIVGRVFFPDWSLFAMTPFDAKDLTSTYLDIDINPNFFEALLLEINPLVFSLTPIVLFSFLATLFRLPSIKKSETPWQGEITMTAFFLLIFILLLIFLDVLAIPRYIILLYPLVAFLAACGIWEGKKYIEKKWLARLAFFQYTDIFISVFIIGTSLVSLGGIQPFYINYANGFLPKNSLISDAWGYGGYEAAQYLNTLPGAENILVWTDYEGVCEFFIGKCMIKQYKYSSKQKIDYAVLTRRGKILYNPDHSRWAKEGNLSMKQAYDNPNPDWILHIDNKPENFIKIVKIEK